MGKFRFYAIKLSAFMIFVFFLQLLVAGFTDLFLLNSDSFFQLWRFVTAIFLHGGAGHLLYNLLALILFGSILEVLIGGRKFLIVFFVTGILANIISVNFYSASLGASGAIFGIIGALIVVKPFQFVWAFGLPMPIIVAGVVWVIGDIIGIFIPDNVGNIAHLSGIFFGILLGFLYREKKKYKRQKIEIDEKAIRQWEDGFLK